MTRHGTWEAAPLPHVSGHVAQTHLHDIAGFALGADYAGEPEVALQVAESVAEEATSDVAPVQV